MAITWFQIDELEQQSWMLQATHLGTSLVSTVVMLFSFGKIERIENRLVIGSCALVGFAISALLAYLAWARALTWFSIALIWTAGAIVGAVSIGHGARYRREIAGANQQIMNLHIQGFSMLARLVAGVFGGLLAANGIWVLLLIDAFTYLPLARIAFTFRPLKPESAKDEDPSNAFEGLRYLFGETRLRMLMILSILSGLTGGLPFILTAEIVKVNFGGGSFSYGGWLAVTGFAGSLGAAAGRHLLKRNTLQGWGFFTSYFAVPFSLIVVASMTSYWWYIAAYVGFVFVSVPVDSLLESEFSLLPISRLNSVHRARATVNNLGLPALWLLITFAGARLGLGPKQILFWASAFSLAVLTALTLYCWRTNLLHEIIRGKVQSEQNELMLIEVR